MSIEGFKVMIPFMIVVFILWGLIASSGAKGTAKKIGTVKCKRCGYTGTANAKAQFRFFQGVSTSMRCKQCGSEDWTNE